MAKEPTAEQATKIIEATYREFIEEPELSERIEKIPMLLEKFEGNYATMIKKLQSKYGKVSPKAKEVEPEVAEEAAEEA
ncbi:MAG TPA: hypothetical protein QF490_06120, partial [Candidatus Thalassarchaeaceae archaeon]|nr:hypothetical protein [Candidatus Thalassarchaeaceae archaeon]HJO84207.1 hypothetical protein [Candidatus Thalassarchaeaceae archaeon]